MPAAISIVIPTLNAAARLPRCLGALGEGLAEGLIHELIVSDGGSSDETRAIADAAGARWITGPASRGGQLRRGCDAARARWLMVLHADTVLDTGWAGATADHLARPESGPACFRLAFDAHGVMPGWVAGWANLRTRALGLPFGDQGLLVQRDHYDRAGGYPDQPLMEDVALARALGQVTLLPARAVTAADRYHRDGWLNRGGRNLWTQLRYAVGADPEKLAARYRK